METKIYDKRVVLIDVGLRYCKQMCVYGSMIASICAGEDNQSHDASSTVLSSLGLSVKLRETMADHNIV